MTGVFRRSIVLLALTCLLAAVSLAGDKSQTLTGTIGDTMCGAKHMGGSAAECTHACVKKGSKYALVVGDKVYALDGGDQAKLDELAGEQATVKGTVEGDTIHVASVAPAKKG